MKKLVLIAILLVIITSVKSQQLFFEAGKTISTFDYKNSQGNSLDNIQPTNYTFMSLGYRMNILTKNLFLNIKGNYNTYGAIGSDIALYNYFEWEMSYLGVGVGLDYEIFKPGNFAFYIKGSASSEFIIQGTQTINDQVYKLPGEEDFDTPLYFFRGGLGVQYSVSEKFALFTEYLYGRGSTFKNIQGDLKINAHNFGFGLLISISNSQTNSQDTEKAQIEQLEKELAANSLKIKELEVNAQQVNVLEKEIIAKEKEIVAKEEEIKSLKESISNALMLYNDTGLSVYERDGNIYITMKNDMLFQSGSWEIGTEGEKAVNALGDVLSENPDVTVLIEGHTDDEPFKGNGIIKNNWDLSTKRATTIVEILGKNKNIDPKNLIAAGRGEYDPIADNATSEGRATNRRIEVIITPKLDKIRKLIQN